MTPPDTAPERCPFCSAEERPVPAKVDDWREYRCGTEWFRHNGKAIPSRGCYQRQCDQMKVENEALRADRDALDWLEANKSVTPIMFKDCKVHGPHWRRTFHSKFADNRFPTLRAAIAANLNPTKTDE